LSLIASDYPRLPRFRRGMPLAASNGLRIGTELAWEKPQWLVKQQITPLNGQVKTITTARANAPPVN
jgi:hypothetical protein